MLSAAPWTLLGIVVFAGVAALSGGWALGLSLAAVTAAVVAGQVAVRGRSRRLNHEAGPGGGVWLGWADAEQVEPLLGRPLSAWIWFLYTETGLPVRLDADHSGLQLRLRGVLLPRLVGAPTRTIPWTDLAGARETRLGFRRADHRPATVRLTAVTLDLVGPSADGYLPELSDEEFAEEMRTLGVDVTNLEDDPDDPIDEAAEDQEEEQFWREIYGPDWRRGTLPLQLTTPASEGLVELVARRARGRPADTPLP